MCAEDAARLRKADAFNIVEFWAASGYQNATCASSMLYCSVLWGCERASEEQ